MAIVHKFNVTEDDYFDYALEYFNEQRLFDSLEMVGRCLDIDPDDFDFGMLRARILYEMELYEEALKQYYCLFLRYTAIPELYLGLVQVFGALGKPSKALYFLETLFEMDLQDDEEEYLESFREFDMKKFEADIRVEPQMRLVEPGIEEYEAAQNHIRSANFADAADNLVLVGKNSEYYSRSLIDRAIIEMSGGRYDSAIPLIDEAVKLEPYNVHFLLTKCMYFYLISNRERFEELVCIIDNLEITEVSDLLLVFNFAMEMKNHAWVVRYGEEVLMRKPYNRATIHFLMQAYYNLEEFVSAKEMLSLLIKIAPNDYVVKYYTNIINNVNKSSLDYTLSLQKEDSVAVVEIIIPDILKAEDFAEDLENRGGELLLDWYFRQARARDRRKIVAKLDEDFVGFLRMQLLSDTLSFGDKLAVLRKLLSLERRGRRDYALCVGDEIAEHDPRPPRYVEVSSAAVRLYLDLYASLSLLGCVNDVRFNRFFKRALATPEFKLPGKTQVTAFMAAFYHKYLAEDDEELTFEDICALFDVAGPKVEAQLKNLEGLGNYKY